MTTLGTMLSQQAAKSHQKPPKPQKMKPQAKKQYKNPVPEKPKFVHMNHRSAQQRAEAEEIVKTDPNSLYRKLYNTNLPFFLWVIEKEEAPYIFKLHVQALTQKEMNMSTVRRSVEALIQVDKQAGASEE